MAFHWKVNPMNQEDLSSFRLQKADELLERHVSPQDFIPVKMAIEKMANPDISNDKLYDKYYNKPKLNKEPRTTKHKQNIVRARTTKVINKYPEIFKPLRDKNIVNMEEILGNLNNIALDDEVKVGDRIKASKTLIDSAVQVEKMSKDKEIKSLTLETVAIEGKSFGDIIEDARKKVCA